MQSVRSGVESRSITRGKGGTTLCPTIKSNFLTVKGNATTAPESFKMNDKEAEYYASEFTDAQIDTMADAGDFYLEESGFCLMPTKVEGTCQSRDS